MATASTTPQGKNKETLFPPRRGQIKAQIFGTVVKAVVSAVSKAKKGEDSDGTSTSTSTTTTPQQSGYNSEGN